MKNIRGCLGSDLFKSEGNDLFLTYLLGGVHLREVLQKIFRLRVQYYNVRLISKG